DASMGYGLSKAPEENRSCRISHDPAVEPSHRCRERDKNRTSCVMLDFFSVSTAREYLTCVAAKKIHRVDIIPISTQGKILHKADPLELVLPLKKSVIHRFWATE